MRSDADRIARLTGRARRCRPSAFPRLAGRGEEAGIALLLALLIIFILSGLAVSIILLTDSQIRLERTVEAQSRVHYAALAGLEEARGRLNSSAPDTITPLQLPTVVTQVLYLVNSSTADPVQPTNSASPYYDVEYVREFTGGLAAATILPAVASDQAGAGTAAAIPYKWVRITLKTEYSSSQDVDRDGVLNSTTPVYWDGSQQDLSTRLTQGVAVYKLTALAVDSTGIRKLVQTEVAGAGGSLTASAAAAIGGSATLSGISVGGTLKGRRKRKVGTPNLLIEGVDACGGSSLPGIIAGGTVTIPVGRVATVTGSSPATIQNASPFPQSASRLISSLRGSARAILNADPTHVSLSSTGTSYVGTNVVLGTQAVGTTPAQPLVTYADKSLSISGSAATGQGILLVNGDLAIVGGFDYNGMIVVNGSVTLTSNAVGTVAIYGTLISSGNLIADSTASTVDNSVDVNFDSCAMAAGYQVLPKTVLAYRELP